MRRSLAVAMLCLILLFTQACRGDDRDFRDPAEAAAVNAALAHARLENQRVLVHWKPAAGDESSALSTLLTDNRDVARKILYEYQMVTVEISASDPDLETLARYGGSFEALPYLTILDAEGTAIATRDAASLMGDDAGDGETLLGFLDEHQAEYLLAADVLDAALAEAKQSERLLFMHSGAPW